MSWATPAVAGVFLAMATHPVLLRSLTTPDPDDTFFHLSMAARVGLVLLVLVACSSLLYFSIKKGEYLHRLAMRRLYTHGKRNIALMLSLLIDLIMTGLLFMFAVSVAPQMFYVYYLTLFPSLSAQWVVSPTYSVDHWLNQIRIAPTDSLADQTIGLLFWTMIFASLFSAGLRVLDGFSIRKRDS